MFYCPKETVAGPLTASHLKFASTAGDKHKVPDNDNLESLLSRL